jgi:hypothetical protein
MKFFRRSKDGGPESPVDAFFLVEIKSLFSVALLRFNPGCREAYHTHAFNAWTWFISGELLEEHLDEDGWVNYSFYKRSLRPKVTLRSRNHRVIADKTSWCLTVRGPWAKTWTEDTDTHHTVLTHGRRIVERHER